MGMAQFDIKRVLAYSTVSQLGYMFLACGVGAFTAGIFHLMTHAFFKALLFLGAGSISHAVSGELDMRKMGDMRKHIPRTYWTFMIATLALCGIFPFAGFFSKDEILFHSLVDGHILYWGIATAAAFITAFYMFRAVFMVFYGKSRVDPEVAHHMHESPPVMTIPLMILAVGSAVGGLVGIPIIKGGHAFKDFLAPSIIYSAGHHEAHYAISFEVGMMLFSMLVALAGIYTAYRMYIRRPELPTVLANKYKVAYELIYNKYFVDEIYDMAVVEPIKDSSQFLWKGVDEKVLDGAVNGSAGVVAYLSAHIRKLETGFLQNYALAIVLGVAVIVGYLVGL
jgi:NADH-quinone oxidoreductase subunit L